MSMHFSKFVIDIKFHSIVVEKYSLYDFSSSKFSFRIQHKIQENRNVKTCQTLTSVQQRHLLNKKSVTQGHKHGSKTIKSTFFFLRLIYCLAVVDLCTWTFSSCSERGLFLTMARWPLTAVASLVERRLQGPGFSSCSAWPPEHRLSSCAAQAQLLQGLWELPRPGVAQYPLSCKMDS